MIDINTTNKGINHLKNVIQELNDIKELPFTDVLTSELIAEVFENIQYRERVYSPDITLFGFLSQVMGRDQSCQAAVAKIIAHLLSQGKSAPSTNTAAYCQARSRLPTHVLSNLAKKVAIKTDSKAHKDWLWRNRSIKIPDGTTISMPDTADNQKMYPQPRTQKVGVGFPLARLVGVFSLATGVLLDLAIAPNSGKGTGEHALLRQLMHVFTSGDIVLGDAYYGSFFLIATFQKMGVDVVFPLHASRNCDFRKGIRLGRKDHLKHWEKPVKPKWMSKETYDSFPKLIKVRETNITTSKPKFRDKNMVIVTTFLDSESVSPKDLCELYGYRWFVELDFSAIKSVMCMGILRGKTAEMVHKEIYAHMLTYNLIRTIMSQSAVKHKRHPRTMSFKLALQVISAFRDSGLLFSKDKKSKIYFELLNALSYKTVSNRPGRSEPRKIKRRPKSFPRMQKARAYYKREIA